MRSASRAPTAFHLRAATGFRRLNSNPDQVASIAHTLKSTSPLERPAPRTDTCDRSVASAEVFFGQATQINPSFKFAAIFLIRRFSSLFERTNHIVRLQSRLGWSSSFAPSGNGPSDLENPSGASSSAIDEFGLMLSFFQ